jgi:8-oxo-dGTP pyrophosphatase MutT (NUDIX family)
MMVTERSAGAVVYRKTAEGTLCFLLLQPAHRKPWGFPKGRLDDGENEEQAARREIREESGLTDIDLDIEFHHIIHYSYLRGMITVKKTVTYFLALAHTDLVQISWEHVAYCWATYEEAMALVVFENSRNTLRKAAAYLHRP